MEKTEILEKTLDIITNLDYVLIVSNVGDTKVFKLVDFYGSNWRGIENESFATIGDVFDRLCTYVVNITEMANGFLSNEQVRYSMKQIHPLDYEEYINN